MKLLSLHIDKYKNLSGDYDFTTQDGYIALIGENGSGKSNLLEAISLIYHGIFDKKEIPFDYTIKYQIGDSIYERGKRIAKKDGEAIKASDIYHPSSIIACYSGEDRRLWALAYKDYYNRYFNKAIGENYYTPKLLYIDKSCWEIALIALICAYDTPTINTFLNNLGITDISDITISFQINEERREMFKKHDALRWFNRVTPDGTININAKTLATTDTNPTSALAQKEFKSKLVFQYLYLLSQPERKEGEPNRVQKLINSIDIKLKNVSYGDLSEGEKKLILIECITKVLGDNNSLLLLDEPDAHTHIARKKDLLEAIETFEGQTILTTHSPVFVNDIYKHHKDCLFHIENGKIISSQYINALTQLSAGEIDYINGTIVLSSKRLLITEGPYDKRYLEKALDIFCNKDEKYKVLRQVAIIPSNSASNADTFYRQVIEPQLDKYEQIVFMFDYDKEGVNGWNGITKIRDPKTKAIFYQSDYSEIKDTNVKNVDAEATFMVEDLFSPNAYKEKVEYIHRKHSHKDFRCNDQGKTTEAIKKHIENNYSRFEDDWFDGYKNVLNKLIDIFNL